MSELGHVQVQHALEIFAGLVLNHAHQAITHLHQDPPEVRLAAELAQRRARLAVQQKELEALELRMKRKFEKE